MRHFKTVNVQWRGVESKRGRMASPCVAGLVTGASDGSSARMESVRKRGAVQKGQMGLQPELRRRHPLACLSECSSATEGSATAGSRRPGGGNERRIGDSALHVGPSSISAKRPRGREWVGAGRSCRRTMLLWREAFIGVCLSCPCACDGGVAGLCGAFSSPSKLPLPPFRPCASGVCELCPEGVRASRPCPETRRGEHSVTSLDEVTIEDNNVPPS